MNLKSRMHRLGVIAGVVFFGGIVVRSHAQDSKPQAPVVDPLPRSQRAPDVRCTKTEAIVTLASAEVARTVNLGFARAEVRPITLSLERNAEIAYNGNRYARLSSRAPGVVSEVLKDLGQHVKQGEVLAVVDSVDLGSAKAELLQALETVNLWQTTAAAERALVGRGAGIEREAREAETRLAESRISLAKARQHLRNLGLSQPQIEAVEKENDTSALLQLHAPFDGLVVERSAVVGEVVEPTSALFGVADTGVMWALIDLQEQDLPVVAAGQSVTVSADGLRGRVFGGPLAWISTGLDPRTRTLKARAEVDNGAGLLRAHMFARATIAARTGQPAITVPKEAVQWEGCCNIVFIKADEAGTRFQPVKVHLGADTGDRYEVLSGLVGGETVVTRGSFLLKTEILKGSIGAGCCEIDHLKK